MNLHLRKKLFFIKKATIKSGDFIFNGVLGATRTPDLQFRRLLLYPTELPGHGLYFNIKIEENIAKSIKREVKKTELQFI